MTTAAIPPTLRPLSPSGAPTLPSTHTPHTTSFFPHSLSPRSGTHSLSLLSLSLSLSLSAPLQPPPLLSCSHSLYACVYRGTMKKVSGSAGYDEQGRRKTKLGTASGKGGGAISAGGGHIAASASKAKGQGGVCVCVCVCSVPPKLKLNQSTPKPFDAARRRHRVMEVCVCVGASACASVVCMRGRDGKRGTESDREGEIRREGERGRERTNGGKTNPRMAGKPTQKGTGDLP